LDGISVLEPVVQLLHLVNEVLCFKRVIVFAVEVSHEQADRSPEPGTFEKRRFRDDSRKQVENPRSRRGSKGLEVKVRVEKTDALLGAPDDGLTSAVALEEQLLPERTKLTLKEAYKVLLGHLDCLLQARCGLLPIGIWRRDVLFR
jgi:hypothetical protein